MVCDKLYGRAVHQNRHRVVLSHQEWHWAAACCSLQCFHKCVCTCKRMKEYCCPAFAITCCSLCPKSAQMRHSSRIMQSSHCRPSVLTISISCTQASKQDMVNLLNLFYRFLIFVAASETIGTAAPGHWFDSRECHASLCWGSRTQWLSMVQQIKIKDFYDLF